MNSPNGQHSPVIVFALVERVEDIVFFQMCSFIAPSSLYICDLQPQHWCSTQHVMHAP